MCDKGRNNKIKISVESYHSFINLEPTATKRSINLAFAKAQIASKKKSNRAARHIKIIETSYAYRKGLRD